MASLTIKAPPPEGRPARTEPAGTRLATLSLAALGVVYGDIGTSPLYAFRACLNGYRGVPPGAADVLGILSLIFWALVIVISVKYVLIAMRADNDGDGGIIALVALLSLGFRASQGKRAFLIALGLFGAALLYGDGMITPAISVLSAIEGLREADPHLVLFVIPITCTILILLFMFQKRGTGRIGAVFGPFMVVWFAILAVLGIGEILRAPRILTAVNPLHAVTFFGSRGFARFRIIGAVFLVVTGGEALYADMGHFGARPIRLAWFALVLPALVLNYFGQGALVLTDPRHSTHPFYDLAPHWALYPIVALATCATIIASQAVISGAFSLTRQAIESRLLAANEDRADVAGGNRAGVRSRDKLDVPGRDAGAGNRFWLLFAVGGGLWRGRYDHDGDHHDSDLCRGPRPLAVASCCRGPDLRAAASR